MIATLPFLESRFKTFNDAYFDGALQSVPIKLGRAERTLGSCTFKKRRSLSGKMHYSDFCIHISTRFDLTEAEIEDVLLHEMIHYEILVNQWQDTSAHGQLFRRRMAEINAAGRHITISHRVAPQLQKTRAGEKPQWRVVARVRLKDGRTGVKVLPRIAQRLQAYRRGMLRSGQVAVVDFYWSDDPFFAHFPKSSALNVFFPSDPDFESRFSTAERIEL